MNMRLILAALLILTSFTTAFTVGTLTSSTARTAAVVAGGAR